SRSYPKLLVARRAKPRERNPTVPRESLAMQGNRHNLQVRPENTKNTASAAAMPLENASAALPHEAERAAHKSNSNQLPAAQDTSNPAVPTEAQLLAA